MVVLNRPSRIVTLWTMVGFRNFNLRGFWRSVNHLKCPVLQFNVKLVCMNNRLFSFTTRRCKNMDTNKTKQGWPAKRVGFRLFKVCNHEIVGTTRFRSPEKRISWNLYLVEKIRTKSFVKKSWLLKCTSAYTIQQLISIYWSHFTSFYAKDVFFLFYV